MSLAYVLVQLSHGLECLRPNRCHLALVHRNLGASLWRRGVVATTLTFWSVPVIVSTAALYHIHLCMKPCVKCKSDAPGYCNCWRGKQRKRGGVQLGESSGESDVSVPSYEDSNSCSTKTAYQAPDRFVAQRKYILRMEQSKEIDLPTEGKLNVLQCMRKEDRSFLYRRVKRYYWTYRTAEAQVRKLFQVFCDALTEVLSGERYRVSKGWSVPTRRLRATCAR